MIILQQFLKERALQQIQRRADHFAECLTSDDPSEWDQPEFERWIKADVRHAEEFRRSSEYWLSMSDAAEELALSSEPASQAEHTTLRRFFRPIPLGLAAAAVIAAIVAVLRWPTPGPTEYTTRTGQRQTVQLADGSTAVLNTRTTMKWLGGREERRATLIAGEALFFVRHDILHPFIVSVDGLEVRVTGTAFDIDRHAADGRVVVTVLDGTVNVRSATPAVSDNPWSRQLQANQSISVRNGSVVSEVHKASGESAVAWRNDQLEIEGPLPHVVDELARYTEIPIVLMDPRLAKVHIIGTFSIKAIPKTLAELETSNPIEVVRSNNRFEIRCRAACDPMEEAVR